MPEDGLVPNKSMEVDPSLLRNRLFRAIDENYNVTNPVVVAEVLGQLERFRLSRAALEATRLDWYIEQLRWREDHRALVSRARNLLQQWRADHTSKPTTSSSPDQETFFRSPSPPGSSLAPPSSSPRKKAREVEERRRVWRDREEVAEREERERKRRRQARWLRSVNYRWQTLIRQL